jgi:hypothetical protein
MAPWIGCFVEVLNLSVAIKVRVVEEWEISGEMGVADCRISESMNQGLNSLGPALREMMYIREAMAQSR